jgi:hypothetical protein
MAGLLAQRHAGFPRTGILESANALFRFIKITISSCSVIDDLVPLMNHSLKITLFGKTSRIPLYYLVTSSTVNAVKSLRSE